MMCIQVSYGLADVQGTAQEAEQTVVVCACLGCSNGKVHVPETDLGAAPACNGHHHLYACRSGEQPQHSERCLLCKRCRSTDAKIADDAPLGVLWHAAC